MKTLAATLVAWGPVGVFLLAALDSAGIPLPSGVDALLLVVSALGPARAYTAALFAIAGSVAGCMFLFYLARKGGEVYLGKHTLTGRGKRLREWFQEYGLVTVFIPALLPIPLPMKVFVLCAGALGTRPLSFIVVVVAARVPRYLGLAFLGSQLRDDAGPWLKDHAPQILIFAAVLMAALFALVKLAHRYRRPASPLQ